MTIARQNAQLSQVINVSNSAIGDTILLPSSGTVNVSGTITATSGNFTSLRVNGADVSISGHSHTSSDISNFNSSVSGLVSGIYVPNTRTITPGSGLVGSSALDLSSNRTLDVGAGDGITVSADAVAVNSTVVRTSSDQDISGVKVFQAAVFKGTNGSTPAIIIDQNFNTSLVSELDEGGRFGLNLGSTSLGDSGTSSNELVIGYSPDNGTILGPKLFTAPSEVGVLNNYDDASSQNISRLVLDAGSAIGNNATTKTTLKCSITNGNILINLPSASGNLALTNDILSVFTPSQNQPPATNFATLDTRNSISVLEFDANTQESAFFVGALPSNADLTNGIRVRLWWMADTATSGNVRWGVSFERVGTDNDADSFSAVTQANGTANGTSGIETVTTITATSGNIDGITAGDRYRLRVTRIADDATNDTMLGDAQLVAVEVRAA